MKIRKLAAAASLATGAALAFAPFAAADVTPIVDSEIAGENSLFETYAALSGVTDVVKGGPGAFDSFGNVVTDAPQATTFGAVTPIETELYGANPILAGISGDSGPYSEFNGALSQFDNAYNVLLYASENNGALDTNINDYIYNSAINHVLTTPNETPTEAYQYLINYGLGDLKGYDAIFAPNATGPGDILPTESNEIVQLNNIFELYGKLTGDFGDIAPHTALGTNVGFDTIDPSKASDAFDSIVFGAAGPSVDPGSYDVMNGSLTEFFNASNVELYSLLNGGDLLPAADIFGTHAEMATVAASVAEYLSLGYQDLLGYF